MNQGRSVSSKVLINIFQEIIVEKTVRATRDKAKILTCSGWTTKQNTTTEQKAKEVLAYPCFMFGFVHEDLAYLGLGGFAG